MKKQPELPDFARDMEILHSLSRTSTRLQDAGPEEHESPEANNQISS